MCEAPSLAPTVFFNDILLHHLVKRRHPGEALHLQSIQDDIEEAGSWTTILSTANFDLRMVERRADIDITKARLHLHQQEEQEKKQMFLTTERVW